MIKLCVLKGFFFSFGLFVFSFSAQAEQLPAPAHLLDSNEWPYCDDPKRLDEDGAIIHIGKRYYRMCIPPLHPYGERLVLLRINQEMREDELGTSYPRSVRVSAQHRWDGLFERRLRYFDETGTHAFAGVTYRKFDNDFINPDGKPSVSLFLYEPELNPKAEPLPEHWLSCKFPKDPTYGTSCFLYIRYMDITLIGQFLHDGKRLKPMPWDSFPEIARDIVELVEFADVTDHREHWPEDVPVFE